MLLLRLLFGEKFLDPNCSMFSSTAEYLGQFSLILSSKFQFYLSLENSLCTDYVTEKFWKVLEYNVIPVVLNGANMSHIAPPHSYIDFKDFNNNITGVTFTLCHSCLTHFVTEAAAYMKKVSEDDELFASYFWWRDFYSPTQSTEGRRHSVHH